MEMVGAGIASLAFWGFMAAAVIVGVWDKTKKREAQHETLRRMIASGNPVDERLMKGLMVGEPKRPDRDLAISAIILFSVAVGMVVLAAALSGVTERALLPLLGSAGCAACIGVGLWAASAYVKRGRIEDGPAGQRMQAD